MKNIGSECESCGIDTVILDERGLCGECGRLQDEEDREAEEAEARAFEDAEDAEYTPWFRATLAEVQAAAADAGWSIEEAGHHRRSHYYALRRAGRTLRVRISDHRTRHEDYQDFSVAMRADRDGMRDDSIEDLQEELNRG